MTGRDTQKEDEEDAPSVVTHSILDLWATHYLCITHTGCRFSVVHLYRLLTCTLDRRNHKIAFECLTFAVDFACHHAIKSTIKTTGTKWQTKMYCKYLS